MSRPKPDPSSADAFGGFCTGILYFLRKRTNNASDAADVTPNGWTTATAPKRVGRLAWRPSGT